MNQKNNGGPAFPIADPFLHQPANEDEAKRLSAGMTLRDYFAAKALPAILAVPSDGIAAWAPTATAGSSLTAAEAWAASAYEIADVMLAERAK